MPLPNILLIKNITKGSAYTDVSVDLDAPYILRGRAKGYFTMYRTSSYDPVLSPIEISTLDASRLFWETLWRVRRPSLLLWR